MHPGEASLRAPPDGYQAYREAMSPLLERIGGGFRYDFTIAKTLRNSVGHEINRVFIIYFPNRQVRDFLQQRCTVLTIER